MAHQLEQGPEWGVSVVDCRRRQRHQAMGLELAGSIDNPVRLTWLRMPEPGEMASSGLSMVIWYGPQSTTGWRPNRLTSTLPPKKGLPLLLLTAWLSATSTSGLEPMFSHGRCRYGPQSTTGCRLCRQSTSMPPRQGGAIVLDDGADIDGSPAS
jgi:hypothetical protein